MPRPSYPPVTFKELHHISREAPSSTVKRLLWEIRRLRVVEVRAGDVLGALKTPAPPIRQR